MRRNTIWILTRRSIAVRLIGAALMAGGIRDKVCRKCKVSELDFLMTEEQAKESGSRRVPHQLGLVTRKDHDPIQPRRVPQLCTSQQQLVRSERNLARRRSQASLAPGEGRLKGVERVVRLFGAELAGELGEGDGRVERGGRGVRLLDFEIGLAVRVRDSRFSQLVFGVTIHRNNRRHGHHGNGPTHPSRLLVSM